MDQPLLSGPAETLEAGRPTVEAERAIAFCLGGLYADTSKRTVDPVVPSLTFEELIGALLLARDVIRQAQEEEEDED